MLLEPGFTLSNGRVSKQILRRQQIHSFYKPPMQEEQVCLT